MTNSQSPSFGGSTRPYPVLQVRDVGVGFGGVRLFSEVEFDCLPGQITCIMGPNGSGKTTLLNVLSGFLRPGEGTVRYYGQSARPFSPLTVARLGHGVARSFQTPFTVVSLSTLDNVAVGRRQVTEGPLGVLKYAAMRDGNENSIRNEARMLLERLGLGGQAEVFGLELSAGQRRRADLARAVFSQSQLLLLDEPFANLDPEVALGVARLLRDIANDGCSVLAIEHRSDLALSIADVDLEISGGRLVPARHASTHASEDPH